MFFGKNRKAFLDFLSRLTTQALFLALAFVLGSGLDLSRFLWTWQGFKNALPMSLCLIVFFGAAIASVTLFMEETIASSPCYDRYAVRTLNLPIAKKQRVCLLVRGVWKYNKGLLVQAVLVIGVMEIGFIATFVMALQGAMASPLLKLSG